MIVLSIKVIVCLEGKISAQPHTTLCIQFLDRENNDKNNTDLLYNSMRLCRNFTSLLLMKCIGKHVSTHLKKTQNEISPLAS